MWTALATTCVTSSMFLTGVAPNLLGVALVAKMTKTTFTWGQWFMGFLPLGLLLFLSLPLVVYWLYPPQVKRSDDVPGWAAGELKKIGRVTAGELKMASLVVLALALWIGGGTWINATTVAVGIVVLMIVLGVVSWDDVLGNRQAWTVFVWFATLVTLADGLARVGVLSWFAHGAAAALCGVPIMTFVLASVAFFFLMHYLFASITAHTTALLPVFLAAAAAVPGVPINLLALALLYSLGLSRRRGRPAQRVHAASASGLQVLLPQRIEDIEHARRAADGARAVLRAPGDHVGVARPQRAPLLADLHLHLPVEHHPQLLVGMRVERNIGPRRQIDAAQHHVLAGERPPRAISLPGSSSSDVKTCPAAMATLLPGGLRWPDGVPCVGFARAGGVPSRTGGRSCRTAFLGAAQRHCPPVAHKEGIRLISSKETR
jgi:hypothetical protein